VAEQMVFAGVWWNWALQSDGGHRVPTFQAAVQVSL